MKGIEGIREGISRKGAKRAKKYIRNKEVIYIVRSYFLIPSIPV